MTVGEGSARTIVEWDFSVSDFDVGFSVRWQPAACAPPSFAGGSGSGGGARSAEGRASAGTGAGAGDEEDEGEDAELAAVSAAALESATVVRESRYSGERKPLESAAASESASLVACADAQRGHSDDAYYYYCYYSPQPSPSPSPGP